MKYTKDNILNKELRCPTTNKHATFTIIDIRNAMVDIVINDSRRSMTHHSLGEVLELLNRGIWIVENRVSENYQIY